MKTGIGILTQLMATGAQDNALRKTRHASTVTELHMQDDTVYLPKATDYCQDLLLYFPRQWGSWSRQRHYPMNCVQAIERWNNGDTNGPCHFERVSQNSKNMIRVRLMYSPIAPPTTTVKLTFTWNSYNTLFEDLNTPTQFDPVLPWELLRIVANLSSCDSEFLCPTPRIFTTTHYLDRDARQALGTVRNTVISSMYAPFYTQDSMSQLPVHVNHCHVLRRIQTQTQGNTNVYNLKEFVGEHESFYVVYMRKEDVERVDKFEFSIGDYCVLDFSRKWLQVRHETLDDPTNPLRMDGYYVLPIPPVFGVEHHTLEIQLYINEDDKENISHVDRVAQENISLYICDMPFVGNQQIEAPTVCLERLLIQVQSGPKMYFHNEKFSTYSLFYNHLSCVWWFVLVYKDKMCFKVPKKNEIVRTKTIKTIETDSDVLTEIVIREVVRPNTKSIITHPFKRLSVHINNHELVSGDGDYFSEVVPMFYGQTPQEKYMAYRVIFHNTPPMLPYDHTFMNTIPRDYSTLGQPTCDYTTLNTSRIDNIQVTVEWDLNVIREEYPETHQLYLEPFAETINVLRIMQGMGGVAFTT